RHYTKYANRNGFRRRLDQRQATFPLLRCNDGQCNDEAEKSLSKTGMKRRDRRGQKKQNRKAAQNTLKNHGAQRAGAQPPDPAPLFSQPGPKSKDDGQEPDERGHLAMAVFEKDSAYPLREWKREHVPTVGGRPVGNTQTGFGAC